MLRIIAVAMTVLSGYDYVAFNGQYTHNVMQVLTAIERALF